MPDNIALTPFVIRTVIDVVFASVENHPDIIELRSIKHEINQNTLDTIESLLTRKPENLGERIIRTHLRSVLGRHGITIS